MNPKWNKFTPIKLWLIVMFASIFYFGVKEELHCKDSSLRKYVRKQLGHKDLHTFLADESINMHMPHDDEVPECDYETMTAKRFFNDYVKKNRPCLFKGYAKL